MSPFLLGLLSWEPLGPAAAVAVLWKAESRDKLRQVPEKPI